MNNIKITVLGCGSSGGVPYVGCDCATCASDNPKNTRMRASILVESEQGTRILFDTSPDLRQQILKHRIYTVDGVVYTHAHADHCHGIDDIRSFNFHAKVAINGYADAATWERIKTSFSYVFQDVAPGFGWYKPVMKAHEIHANSQFSIADIELQSFLQLHGKSETLGYSIGNFAYSTDVNNLPEVSLEVLDNLDVWLVDCLRYTPAPTHAHLEMTLGWIERVNPKLAILTHMGHEMEYQALAKQLPPNIIPAYDGMCIQLESGRITLSH